MLATKVLHCGPTYSRTKQEIVRNLRLYAYKFFFFFYSKDTMDVDKDDSYGVQCHQRGSNGVNLDPLVTGNIILEHEYIHANCVLIDNFLKLS